MILPSHNGLPTTHVHAGLVSPAVYRPQEVPGYRGNPCIEALPDISDPLSVAEILAHYPTYRAADRNKPNHLRLHLIWDTLQDLFVCDDRHTALESQVGLMVRAGYKGRNPAHPAYWGALGKKLSAFDGSRGSIRRSGAKGLGLVGISGGGKSTTLGRILDQFGSPVIRHTAYHGVNLTVDQLVWLKLECPSNGSTKALCDTFLNAVDARLGTSYHEDYGGSGRTKYELIPAMARIAAIHCLGLLVIDEIQVLSERKSGGAVEMLNFFVELINTIGVPMILVGTYQATPILSGKFRQARRVSGYGDCIWRPMAEDEEWQFFIEALWRYDYLRKSTPLTAELSHVLYEETQGIADLAVKVYALAQWRAITSQTERITEEIIRSVALDSLQLSRPMLNALRAGDDEQVRKIGDIAPVNMDDLLQRELSRPSRAREKRPRGEPVSGHPSERMTPSNGGRSHAADMVHAPDQPRPEGDKPDGALSVGGSDADASAGRGRTRSRRGHRRTGLVSGGQGDVPGSLMAMAAAGATKAGKTERAGATACEVLRQAGMMRSADEWLSQGGR